MKLSESPERSAPHVGVSRQTLAAFHDEHASRTYVSGLVWVGYMPDTLEVLWTEGVRLAERSDAVDMANLLPVLCPLIREPWGKPRLLNTKEGA